MKGAWNRECCSVLLGLNDKAKIALLSKLSNFYFDLRPPRQTPGQGSENPTPGATRICKSPGSPRGMVRLGIDLYIMYTLHLNLTNFCLFKIMYFEFNRNVIILIELLMITSFYRTRDGRGVSVSTPPSRSIENS